MLAYEAPNAAAIPLGYLGSRVTMLLTDFPFRKIILWRDI
jgi:hypothetical protein